MPLTTAMIARAMPAAIRPYSIAVAPDSSDKNFEKTFFKLTSKVFGFYAMAPGSARGTMSSLLEDGLKRNAKMFRNSQKKRWAAGQTTAKR